METSAENSVDVRQIDEKHLMLCFPYLFIIIMLFWGRIGGAFAEEAISENANNVEGVVGSEASAYLRGRMTGAR